MLDDQSKPDAAVLTHQGPDGEPVIVVSGRLGMSCVGRLRDEAMTLREETRQVLRIDTSRVHSIDAVGWRTLVACRRLVAASGAELRLVRPSIVIARQLHANAVGIAFHVEQQDPKRSSRLASHAPDRAQALA